MVVVAENLSRKRLGIDLCAKTSFPNVRVASGWLTELCAATDFPNVAGASLPSRLIGVQFRQAGRWHQRRGPNNSFKPTPLRGAA